MARKSNPVKDFISRMSAGQIIASVIFVIGFVIFLLIYTLPKAYVSTNNTPLIIFFLTIMLLLSRLSIIVKVGIGFLSYILFPLQMVFGPLLSFVMILSTTAVYIWIAVRPTPLDFLITKGVAPSMAQAVYLSLWTIAMIPLFKFLSVAYIMENLVFVYMISVIVYVIFMVICLPLLAMEPVPLTIVNGIMMTTFQFFLISYTGRQFFEFVINLG